MFGAIGVVPGGDEWRSVSCSYVSLRKLSCSTTSLFGKKEKICSCLHHERIWGKWRYNSTHSQLRLKMDVSDYYLSNV